MSATSIADTVSATATPLTKKDRILFLDSIRGMALLGILLMNSMSQSQSGYFYNNMNLDQPITGRNFYAWVIELGFFEGTMRGLFSILFGAGTILLISRLEKTRGNLDAADIYYRRILWLLVFGLINAFIFLWFGDILYSYAICGLFLFPFRNLSPRILLICAVLMLAFGTYRDTAHMRDRQEMMANGKQAELLKKQHKKLTKDQEEELGKWTGFKERASSKGQMKLAIEETVKIQHASYPKLFAFIRDRNMDIQSNGLYNGWWDILTCFFIGMALFKSGFITGGSPAWVYVAVAITGVALGFLINYAYLKVMYTSRFDYVKYNDTFSFELYEVRRIVQTIGYLSTLILLYKLVPLRRVFHIFAPVGQMAFTNYLSQSIFAAIFFYGMGWYGYFQRYQIYELVACVWLFQIIFSTIWLRYFMFGPFEWVWRSLTYLKAQPFIRPQPAPDEPVTLTVAGI